MQKKRKQCKKERRGKAKMQNRNQAIDAVKGFAILLVMLGHCIVLNGLQKGDPYLYDAIKSVQMPLFMAVSGAVAGLSYAKRKCVHLTVIRKRAGSYLVPFFSWFVLIFLATHIPDKTICVSLFWEELTALLFQTDRGLWFLTTLFEVTVFVMLSQALADMTLSRWSVRKENKEAASDKIEKKEKSKEAACDKKAVYTMVACACFSLLFYLLLLLQARSGFSFFSPYLAVQYMPFYVLFYLYFAYRESVTKKSAQNPGEDKTGRIFALICLIGFASVVIGSDLTKAPQGLTEQALQMMTSLMGTIACFYLVYHAYQKKLQKEKDRKLFLPFIGTYTLEIYVLHFRFARLLGIGNMQISLYSLKGIGYVTATFVLMSICTAVCIFLLRKIKIANKLLFGK